MISDELLAAKALDGDLGAFEELVDKYKKSVFAIVYRIIGQYQEAEDITQEVFLIVYEKLYQFDMGKKFAPWIHKIAVNTTISALRKKKKAINVSFDETYIQDNTSGSDVDDPQTIFERTELSQFINEVIMELPENYRVIIALRYQMDYSNGEIAEVLGISKENVEVKVHRARKAMRNLYMKKLMQRGMPDELPASR
ncbi:MAG TPA: sigma-70 family RNA polymerase sigma factor [Syntrophomonadaceae bacterium]|nr:sigma-70 family RNA polymerase sigma factor [Syntrophomonadaceae bacterium]HPR94398.1 sigma-70 family RNA polymerase sigma factor [Syntrophomonadaceae bacterium]